MTQQRELMSFNDLDIGQLNNFGAFLTINTSAKKIIALGGANTLSNHSISNSTYQAIFAEAHDSKPFHTFETSLKTFVDAVNAHAQFTYQRLTGIDYDFEPPITDSGAQLNPDDSTLNDYNNLYALVMQTRADMGPDFYISVTITMNRDYLEKINNSVNGGWFAQIANYADAINVMTYDMHGAWGVSGDPGTLPQTLLKMPEGLTHAYAINYGTVDAMQQILGYGIPANKLQVGIATYGRGFNGVSSVNHGFDQPWTGPATFDKKYTEDVGMLPYWAVPLLMQNEGYQRYAVKDAEGEVIGDYLFSDAEQQFVGYEGTDEEMALCEYAMSLGIQGAILWSMDSDARDDSSLIAYYYRHCAS